MDSARTNDGWTSLMWPCRDGRLEIVQLLFHCGADKHAVDIDGATAHSIAQAAGAGAKMLALLV